jgi:hypothetical protein
MSSLRLEDAGLRILEGATFGSVLAGILKLVMFSFPGSHWRLGDIIERVFDLMSLLALNERD